MQPGVSSDHHQEPSPPRPRPSLPTHLASLFLPQFGDAVHLEAAGTVERGVGEANLHSGGWLQLSEQRRQR